MFERRKKRLDTIRTLLERQGTIHLKSAAETLGVSDMTIRRDIAASKAELAYLGGYIISGKSLPGTPEYKMNTEEDRNTRNKERVGRIAASMVEQGDTIFVDCGTTTPHIISALPEDLSITVVCHALNIANLASRLPKANLILLGGVYYSGTMVFKSDPGLTMLEQVAISKAFISVGGIHAERGLTCSHFYEVDIKQSVMRGAVQRYMIADSSKFSLVKPACFGQLSEAETIITNPDIPDDYRAILDEIPLNVMTSPKK
ncbi:MAG: DeoR/GlpR family DNA-binding transcription regulator [Desulfovibrio sp.]|uniref:DeoR/GlpR family DNA-binding transcription regulator n=1 Tax=Desulfovibrio sp. 7SRBS1 TaxID=3378064 RepID=UPI003B3E154B